MLKFPLSSTPAAENVHYGYRHKDHVTCRAPSSYGLPHFAILQTGLQLHRSTTKRRTCEDHLMWMESSRSDWWARGCTMNKRRRSGRRSRRSSGK